MTTRTLRAVDELAASSLVPHERIDELARVTERYALAITPAMAELIDPRDPNDPIARQFVPDLRELDHRPEESADPIGDNRHSPVEGIVHRYRDRVLLKIVHVCPVYCRFCFRREMVGPDREPSLSPKALDRALAYVADHPEISEVILTGGDPFVLTARRAADLAQRLAAIAHVKILRWHTRVPTVDPQHVTPEFVAAIKSRDKASYVALHVNHAREFTPAAREACARIVDAGVPMLSQTVLLKGVNDDAGTLADLMRAFVENVGRQRDARDAAAEFARQGLAVFDRRAEMRRAGCQVGVVQIVGFDAVLDIPGGCAKANLETCSVERSPQGHLRIRDDEGDWHDYPAA